MLKVSARENLRPELRSFFLFLSSSATTTSTGDQLRSGSYRVHSFELACLGWSFYVYIIVSEGPVILCTRMAPPSEDVLTKVSTDGMSAPLSI